MEKKSSIVFWAGVGSRSTPADICVFFTQIAKLLYQHNLILRSGGADGADIAFEKGYQSDKAVIYRPHHADAECLRIAQELIPWWEKMSDYAKKLHGRNVKQILGDDLKTPVKFVLCWTKDGKEIGGTRTAIVLAKKNNIPVFNFYHKEKTMKEFTKFLQENGW